MAIMFHISAAYENLENTKDNKGIKGIYESYHLLQVLIEVIMGVFFPLKLKVYFNNS